MEEEDLFGDEPDADFIENLFDPTPVLAATGLSVPEIINTIDELKKSDLLDELKLLHFHIGSQISDISVIKDALQEGSQIFVELSKLGAPMKYMDVGGSLTINLHDCHSNASRC